MSVTIEYIDAEESWRIFDDACRRHLSMSGAEFAQRRSDGSLDEDAYDHHDFMAVAMMYPFARTA